MTKTEELLRSKATRVNILLYLSAFVAFLGAPLFFFTTLIHRAHLPAEDVQHRVDEFAQSSQINIPVYFENSQAIPGLIEHTQQAIDASLAQQNLARNWGLTLQSRDAGKIDKLQDYVVRLEEHQTDVNAESINSYKLSKTSKEIGILTHIESLSASDLASYICQVLLEIVFKDELAFISTLLADVPSTDVVFPYSPTYNVVFNLFVEDGRQVDWPIEEAVEFIQPVFDALSNSSTFKPSSQIQYYSKLQSEPILNEDGTARIIPQSDLATFINYGEWNLNTHDIAPSINFLVFFPQSTYANVHLLAESSKTNSFLIPQWGGVHIYNANTKIDRDQKFKFRTAELNLIFDIFASQLFELLGVPNAPLSPALRIAAFHRITTLKNLKRALNNLTALLKLSSSLNGISIPESTREHVLAALENYDIAVQKLHQNDFGAAVAFAGRSVEQSDKAFFEKEMVQQAYFPSEHKLAVFLPLLGPICSIVFFGLLKYLRSRKTEELSSEELKKKQI
ncbi:hypothetical protein METBIDRAFT_32229 [Metschnikowia bicuspidata var. bicuspidata NRRL YB-4993]|uniref:GPI transamidase component PIG-S n=1 Tax=Metschnikowia bicuspidata var. bicuspidata NRRL YB-4993 TaxID=869754 RepID=A0A1A0H7X5_9ASCO|nr:hypothetical protein METBIDRAFT_32229 [Metschnikowia bicuspidata var. bicuspidata NRRL YB-4993]OBA20199.1 hypothetical protein METBIDRAFT_32229 [Metschnikowia bicuspidata var. bicuspidata NRRL YB-4993]